MLTRMDMRGRFLLVGWAMLWLGNISPIVAQPSEISFQRHVLTTRWDADVQSTNAHPEYPRPIMSRPDWLCLNGNWDLAITGKSQTNRITTYTNKILVPFPVESQLSGIHRLFTEMQRLWYRRYFTIPEEWKGQRVLLHFEAADWKTTVWVNGKRLGTHKGGYDRFTFDITDALNPHGSQEIVVSVTDPSDSGFQPLGKQMLHPRPPFFSAISGIWQTVWLEPVPPTSIKSLKLVPDIDSGVLKVTVLGRGPTNNVTVEAEAWDGKKQISNTKAALAEEFQLSIPHAKLWSPSNPFLYNLKVTLKKDGKKVDEVTSYFGMRKISVAKDEDGYPKLLLNDKPLFELGVLDQGYWPDGIYTAPSDKAIQSDIETMKELGFNMCRKHVKVEPDRWYYWCDKLGILVWQDMPNGDQPATSQHKEIKRSPESAHDFEHELKRMIQGRGNHPCIVMWLPFNQGWGQYDTVRITHLIKKLDPSRLVADVTGWYDMGVGDVRSLHQYPGPASPAHDGKRAWVMGECGGLGLRISDHLWGGIVQWNTTFFQTSEQLTAAYDGLITNLKTMKDKEGLAAAVVTQWTDVERELNGFLTYDRAVIKMPVDKIRKYNALLTGASTTTFQPDDELTNFSTAKHITSR